jgi:hypothetical protein
MEIALTPTEELKRMSPFHALEEISIPISELVVAIAASN